MTFVTAIAHPNARIIFGDILLSSLEEEGSSLYIPSIGDRTRVFPNGSGFVPTGLVQKIVKIGDKLIIGWSGSKVGATALIRDLRERNAVLPFTPDSFLEYARTIDYLSEELLPSIIAFIADEDKWSIVGWGTEYKRLDDDSFALFIGGGYGHVDDAFGDWESLFLSRNIVSRTGETTGFLEMLSNCITFTGQLLSDELRTGEGILHYYGGAYEVAFQTLSGFQKLDNFTSIYWELGNKNNELQLGLRQIVKHIYVDEDLYIYTGQPSELVDVMKPPESHVAWSQACTVVPTLFTNPSLEEAMAVPWPSFNSPKLFNHVTVDTGKETYCITAISSLEEGTDHEFVTIVDTGTALNIIPSEQLIQELIAIANNLISSPRPSSES